MSGSVISTFLRASDGGATAWAIGLCASLGVMMASAGPETDPARSLSDALGPRVEVVTLPR